MKSTPPVTVRGPDGVARALRSGQVVALTEAQRVDANLRAIADAASPPWQCGDAVPVAPARGAVARFTPVELIPDGQGGVRPDLTGYRCRDGARVRDVFDEMIDQAWRAHARKGREAGPFEPPFTWGQVEMARAYAALSERCDASGVKCSSLEAQSGMSRGGGREEAVLDDLARLRALHRRIGTGLAKRLRRHRPTGSASRRVITVRDLVDRVCLRGHAPKKILQDAGWVGSTSQIRDLRAELCMALDRMQGFRMVDPQNVG